MACRERSERTPDLFCDTSAFIDYMRGHPAAVPHFEQIGIGSERGLCSAITETELWAGMRSAGEELEIITVLSKFDILPVTSNVARRAGGLLRGKSRSEKNAHFGDALIAASAMEAGETILTADASSQRVFGSQAAYLVYR